MCFHVSEHAHVSTNGRVGCSVYLRVVGLFIVYRDTNQLQRVQKTYDTCLNECTTDWYGRCNYMYMVIRSSDTRSKSLMRE